MMGDVGRPFRAIAPRTIPSTGGGAGQLPGGNNGGGAPDDGRMKRASTACKECQKRRTRVLCPSFPPQWLDSSLFLYLQYQNFYLTFTLPV